MKKKKRIKKKPMDKVKASIKKNGAYIYTSALKPLLKAWDTQEKELKRTGAGSMKLVKREMRKLKALVRQCEKR